MITNGDFVKFRHKHGAWAWGPDHRIGYVVDADSHAEWVGVYDITPIVSISRITRDDTPHPEHVHMTIYFWSRDSLEVYNGIPYGVKERVVECLQELGLT